MPERVVKYTLEPAGGLGKAFLGQTWIPGVMALMALMLAGAGPVGVLSHGTEDRYWIGVLMTDPADPQRVQMVLRVRQAGSDRWTPLGRFPVRATGLAHHRQDLAVLLEDGRWMLIWEGGQAPGSRPDRVRRLLALSTEGRNLWALGEMDDSETLSDGGRLVIHRLEQGQWTHHAFVPADVSSMQMLSMSVVQGQPVLAYRQEDGSVRVLQLPREGDWIEIARITPPQPVLEISLIHGLDRVTLWLGGVEGSGWLYVYRQGEWAGPIDLGEAPLEQVAYRSVTFATGALRLLFMDDQGRIMERSYTPDGQSLGEARELPAVRTVLTEQMPMSEWVKLSVMILLTVLLIALLRRGQPVVMDPARPPVLPAPLSLRLGAGVVDLLPVVLSVGYIIWYSRSHPELSPEALHESMQPLFQTSIAVYLLHTTFSEWISGRTIGKRLFGLQVVMTDEQPARPLAVFIRNLLRMVDFMIFPLLLVVFSPLRQRIGDVAAGTVVVRRNVAVSSSGQ